MLRLVSASLCGVLACAALAVTSAQAAEPLSNRFDFRDLEYRYDDDQVLPVAQSELAARYPVGSSAAEAVRGITRAGGRCSPDDGTTRCTYVSFEAKDDALVEVDWTVRTEGDATGALRTLTVDRSLGGVR